MTIFPQCTICFADCIVVEVNPELVQENNPSGIGRAFGAVKNPFGYDVDVLFWDPPDDDDESVDNSQAVNLPEPIERKFLTKCLQIGEFFTTTNGEEYHLVGVDDKGSHWEVFAAGDANAAGDVNASNPQVRSASVLFSVKAGVI